MPGPAVRSLRDRLPAALLTVLFHVAIIAVLLNAIPKHAARAMRESETIIPLPPLEKSKPAAKSQSARGRSAISPYNYAVIPPFLQEQPNLQGLALALSSCAPENYGNGTDEVRAACKRIGMAVAANPDAFGLKPDYKNGKRWERELLIKQTSLLLPCASPNTSALNIVNLATLLCMSDIVLNGYDPDKMQHYSK
jgi:hypothetical protein